ncbi:MAG: hypothetical protein NTX50_26790 [Candidatus Sumerlaeota bacterium]|nr:hypothetical protein [Candidatus Sumerlaeota bacterium]
MPCETAGDRGVAVRVLAPKQARYDEGAPVVIHVQGGVQAGDAAGPPEYIGLGFVEIYFAFPGGGRGETASGGTYDYRGPKCVRALADVIRFATGRIACKDGRKIGDIVKDVKVLTSNCGIIGSSNGGNACSMVMAAHGKEFPDLAFYVSMESPYGEGAVNAELGGFEMGLNPAYDPKTGILDLAKLAWSPNEAPFFFRRLPQSAEGLKGALFFDVDGDGQFTKDKDYAVNALMCDAGAGLKAYYSPRLLKEAERRNLYKGARPSHVPSLSEGEEFWRWRDGVTSLSEAVKNCPDVAVIVYAGERDHVQAAPDHPHILAQVEGFRKAGARFVRLNCDRAYMDRLLQSPQGLPRKPLRAFSDNEAGKAYDRSNIVEALEPAGPPIALYVCAAVCEAADRAQAKNFNANLDEVIYPGAPSSAPGPRPQMPRGAQ